MAAPKPSPGERPPALAGGSKANGLAGGDQQHGVLAQLQLLHPQAGRIQKTIRVEDEPITEALLPGLVGFRVVEFKQLVGRLPAQVQEAGAGEDLQAVVLSLLGGEGVQASAADRDGVIDLQEVLQAVAAQFRS